MGLSLFPTETFFLPRCPGSLGNRCLACLPDGSPMPNDACWLSSTVPGQFPATENPSDDFADVSIVWGGRVRQGSHVGQSELRINHEHNRYVQRTQTGSQMAA